MVKISKENQIINDAVNTEWFFLTKRPDIPPLPVWYKLKLSALSKENKKIYSTGIPYACFWYENNVEFYLHGDEYRLAIKKATEILHSKQKLNKHLSKLKQACHNAQEVAIAFNNQNWKKFDNKKLFNLYLSVVDQYVLSYIYGFITWCNQVLQYDAKLVINKYSETLNKINISPDQALSILIIPDDLTIYQEKEIILDKLSKKYKRVLDGYKSKNFVLNNYPKLYKEIEKFIDQYCWVGFNYSGPALDYKATVNELLQSRNEISSDKLPTKKDIYRICKFNNKEKHLFYALEMMSYAKDFRNTTDDCVHYCLSNFYNEVSKRTGIAKKDVAFLWDDELHKLINDKIKITSKYIEKKRKFCAAIALSKSVGAKQYSVGNEASNYREQVLKSSNQLAEILSGNIIKGTIASTGVAVGIVKIINSVREVEKVKKGDILVAGMTSPKYMPAIFNSSAIITDDGGITCHAAITARELKKPCIIGTKIATQVLKDGDLVEVDAERGIVTILKKADANNSEKNISQSKNKAESRSFKKGGADKGVVKILKRKNVK